VSWDSIELLESANVERKEAAEAVFCRDWWRLDRRSSIAWCFFWSAGSMGPVGFGLERSDGGGDSSSMLDRGGWRWIRE
jgi:hypothetical protein